MGLIKTVLSLPFSRARKMACDTIVLHATAGASFTGAYQALKSRELSYHAIIEDQREQDGEVNKLVPYSRVAFHAGKSVGPHGENVNNYSVGISFVNRNDGVDGYSLEQIKSAKALVTALKTQFPIKWITTHAIISPGRKTDPRNFPIEEFAADVGLRLWRP